MRGVSSWHLWAVLATVVADVVAPLETTMTVDPATGNFGLCFSDDCAKSLSISLYRTMANTNIDYSTNEVLSSMVLSDFSALDPADLNDDGFDDPMITRTDGDISSNWKSGTLYARTCIMAHCNPRASNENEFQRLFSEREDAIGIKLDIEHVEAFDDQIDSTYESYDVAHGALRLNLSLAISPASDQPDSLPMFGISFLVAAYENYSPTVITSSSYYVDGHMYLQRISFGSDMFLDLPRYATINGVDTTIYTAIKGQLSGELEDLVMVTLMFGPVANSVEYEAAFSSVTLVDSNDAWSSSSSSSSSISVPPSSMPSPAPTLTPTPSPVILDSSGNALPTQLLTKPRGEFGMCLDATCSTDGTLSMGFAGLQVQGSSPLQLSRFANSPAFQFSSPTRMTMTDPPVDVLMSSFSVYVPQSAFRAPKATTSAGDPTFSAAVGQFLADASVDYGGETIHVPRGSVKYSIEIRDWVFASPSDVLVLSMGISLTRSDSSLASVAANYSYVLDGDNLVLTLDGIGSIDFLCGCNCGATRIDWPPFYVMPYFNQSLCVSGFR